MTVRELRIGNYVKVNETIEQVQGVVDPSITAQIIIHGTSFNADEVSPIELTPELLEAAGFKKADSSHLSPGTFVYRSGNFTMVRQTLKAAGDSRNDMYFLHFFDTPLGKNIQYLHQLQNIWHSLTDTELHLER